MGKVTSRMDFITPLPLKILNSSSTIKLGTLLESRKSVGPACIFSFSTLL
jgi:hypothetical protein